MAALGPFIWLHEECMMRLLHSDQRSLRCWICATAWAGGVAMPVNKGSLERSRIARSVWLHESEATPSSLPLERDPRGTMNHHLSRWPWARVRRLPDERFISILPLYFHNFTAQLHNTTSQHSFTTRHNFTIQLHNFSDRLTVGE